MNKATRLSLQKMPQDHFCFQRSISPGLWPSICFMMCLQEMENVDFGMHLGKKIAHLLGCALPNIIEIEIALIPRKGSLDKYG